MSVPLGTVQASFSLPVKENEEALFLDFGKAPRHFLNEVYEPLLLGGNSSLTSETEVPTNEEEESDLIPYSFLPKRSVCSHVQGKGIGYDKNYTKLGITFAPLYELRHLLPMIDLRGERFDDDTYAANAGLIARFIPKRSCEILGVNAYYDYRQGAMGSFNQLGVGMEAIGRRWDFRANGYIPLGAKRYKSKCVFDDYIGEYVAILRENEFASYSFNAEVGYLFSKFESFFFYTAVGAYYLASKCGGDNLGVEVRVRPSYKDYLGVEFRMTHDPIYQTLFQGEIFFSIPLYEFVLDKNKKGPCSIPNRKIYQPVERFEIIPLSKRTCWDVNW